MKLDLDREANAAYVRVRDGAVARTNAIDPNRMVDLDERGEIVGIEFLSPLDGVDLHDLPNPRELERLFGGQNIRTVA